MYTCTATVALYTYGVHFASTYAVHSASNNSQQLHHGEDGDFIRRR